MKFACLLIGLTLNLVTLFGQHYQENVFLKTYPKSYFATQYGLTVSYDVKLYRITYTTTDTKGAQVTASGLVCLPDQKTSGYPMVVYHHGTVGEPLEVPSYLSFENVLPSIYSSFGFIAIAPDYLGLGANVGVHPYIHAASEASASQDMLLATLEFIDELGYNTTKDLFLSGYSQGGHAGMALHRNLETINDLGFDLKAATHMSGPYSISTSMKALLLSDSEYQLVAYLANVALSYNLVYGIFPDGKTNRFFKAPYAAMIDQYANDEITLWELNSLMIDSLKAQYGTSKPKLMIRDEILDSILQDNDYIVNRALRDNDVYDWAPKVPTRLLYCKNDDQVSYTNSLLAEEEMKGNGAPDVKAIDVKSNANHTDCVSPAMTQSIFFFFNYLIISSDTEEESLTSSIYPNPASQFVTINHEEALLSAIAMNVDGRTYALPFNDHIIQTDQLSSGQYILLVKDVKGKLLKWKMSKF